MIFFLYHFSLQINFWKGWLHASNNYGSHMKRNMVDIWSWDTCLQFSSEKKSNTGSTRVFHHLLECPFYIRCPKGKRLYTQWSYWRSEVSSLEKSALWRVSLNQPPCCLLLIERYLLFWKTNRTFGASWKTHMFCRKKNVIGNAYSTLQTHRQHVEIHFNQC